MTNFQILCREIVERSASDSWDNARKEWHVIGMEKVDSPEICLCGHPDIVEVFILRNANTGHVVRIGSVCVNRFIQKNNSFIGYKRIVKDCTKSVTLQLLDFAYGARWINEWEYNFYKSIFHKRTLSPRQSNKKQLINSKIIKHIQEGDTI